MDACYELYSASYCFNYLLVLAPGYESKGGNSNTPYSILRRKKWEKILLLQYFPLLHLGLWKDVFIYFYSFTLQSFCIWCLLALLHKLRTEKINDYCSPAHSQLKGSKLWILTIVLANLNPTDYRWGTMFWFFVFFWFWFWFSGCLLLFF